MPIQQKHRVISSRFRVMQHLPVLLVVVILVVRGTFLAILRRLPLAFCL